MAFNMRLVPPPPRQVLLYLLLMRERYAAEVSSGLLWNVCHERTDLVTYDPSLIASLMQGRNALIAHLTSPRAALPPMKQNERFCSKCSQNRACALMHKVCVRTLVVQGPAAHPCVWACSVRLTFQTQYVTRYQADEGGTAESAQMGDVFAKVTAHLSDTHLAFWRNMLRAVDLEEASQASRKAEIWTMSGACMCVPLRARARELLPSLILNHAHSHSPPRAGPVRERQGRCLSGLSLLPDPTVSSTQLDGSTPKWQYTFKRGARGAPPLDAVGFADGEFVVLSLEGASVVGLSFVHDPRLLVHLLQNAPCVGRMHTRTHAHTHTRTHRPTLRGACAHPVTDRDTRRPGAGP